jgi:hypothetical protein
MRRTNVDAEVTGMLRIGLRTCPVAGSVHASCGKGPTMLRPLYIRYVDINDTKSMHSEPMKAQIAIFRLSRPSVV